MDASVIVCTYNRADSLQETLQAIKAQELPGGYQWEVVVVDNNSTDRTRVVVEELREDWPGLRYEFEGQQGLSCARNHGIAVAQGDIVLFTDDDVLPEPDWVAITVAGMTKYEADACGGFIAPIWETPPPSWMTERFHGFLAIRTERVDDYIITKVSDAPFGANMAFRRKLFDCVGGFDTTRGRKGAVLASGEDGELFERILSAGLKAVFLGQARVHHKVESFRLTKRYLRRWRFQTSRNLAQSTTIMGERRLGNIPLYMFPQFLRALGRMFWGRIAKAPDEAFNREMVVCHFLGTFQGLWKGQNERCRAYDSGSGTPDQEMRK